MNPVSKALLIAMTLAAVVTISPGCSSDVDTIESGHGGSGDAKGAGCVGNIGVMLPYGGASGTDTFQMNWARVALDTFNRRHSTEFSLEPKNVDFDTAQAVDAARALAADPSVVGVVGPPSSAAVSAAGPILDSADLSYVSPSAGMASLTGGSLKNFSRVVASDSVQGPDIAGFIASDLSPRRVLVIDDPGPYSVTLSKSIASILADKGIEVSVSSLDLQKPGYDAVLKAMTRDTNIVVLAMSDPRVGQSLATAITKQGFDPTVVSADVQFDVSGAYFFSFSPSIESVDGGEQLVRAYRDIFGDLQSFGAPAYVAMEVVLTAALESCEGRQATRAGVTQGVRKVSLPSTILGYPVAFDSRGDLKGGRFFLYRNEGGRLVEQQGN